MAAAGGNKGERLCGIGDLLVYGMVFFFKGQAYPHFSSFPFLLILLGFGHAALFFAVAVFRVFPLPRALHVPSRIDRGELIGAAVLRSWLQPSSTGMPAGRGSLAAPLLQRRGTGNPHRVESIDRMQGVWVLYTSASRAKAGEQEKGRSGSLTYTFARQIVRSK